MLFLAAICAINLIDQKTVHCLKMLQQYVVNLAMQSFLTAVYGMHAVKTILTSHGKGFFTDIGYRWLRSKDDMTIPSEIFEQNDPIRQQPPWRRH